MSDNPDRVSMDDFCDACYGNEMGPIRRYVSDQGDDIHAADEYGWTGLHGAAIGGHVEVCRFLVENGADTGKRDDDGKTAAQLAEERNFPMVLAMLDPARARELGKKLRRAFEICPLGHVTSTRYRRAKGFEKFPDNYAATLPDSAPGGSAGMPLAGELTCDPNFMAALVKKLLQEESSSPGDTMVFNPNFDNAFLMDGVSENADAIWLRNWREVGLESARRTGGACVQLVTPPGLSEMQIAEADMAMAAGVRVVKLDCTQMTDYGHEAFCAAILRAMPAFAELVRAGARELPLTHDRLLELALQSADGAERASIEAEMRHATTTRAILGAARSQRAAGGVSEGVPPEPEPEPEPRPLLASSSIGNMTQGSAGAEVPVTRRAESARVRRVKTWLRMSLYM